MKFSQLFEGAASLVRRRRDGVPAAAPTTPAGEPVPWYHARIDATDLRDYQKYQLKSTIALIHRLFPDEDVRKSLRVLDIGCTPAQDRILSRFVGHVSGTNLGDIDDAPPDGKTAFFPSEEDSLPFPDGTFDFAFSLNVMEHLRDTRAMLAEHIRVVRPGGFGYMEWCAQWGCYAGHHIFEPQLRVWEDEENWPRSPFKDGGDFVPDWGHLFLTPEQMRARLDALYGPGFEEELDRTIDLTYHSTARHGLSRLFLDEVMEIVRSFDIEIFEFNRMEMPAPKEVKILLEALHGEHDYDAHYAAVIFRKPLTSG